MSQAIVAQSKADLLAAGKDLSGNDNAFLIVMEAASRLPGAGVVDKPNGNHAAFNGAFYSVDGIMYQDGRFFDCLVDGGGANTPVWNQGENIDASRWRAPVSILNKPAPTTNPHPSFEADMRSFDQDVRASLGRVEGALEETAIAQEELLEAATQVIAATQKLGNTAYVKISLLPNKTTGGFDAYVKFDLKPVKA